MVFYRKYRPQTIEELDSEAVQKTLRLVLTAVNTPHAFLFTGPKGLGKTSTARIVAKYINCERNLVSRSDEKKLSAKRSMLNAGEIPCNTCASCMSITDGTNLDVLEIDGASNRGIDEIRDLRGKIRLLPVSAVKKVYIIDEVHMLTTEAFNALLKTLEEPPPHAMFILCTTEQQKVPATILSRCFHIQFQKATIEDLVHSFERIVKAEKIAVEKDTLISIAAMADGSFRDGVKVLEEIVVAGGGHTITKQQLESFYHVDSIDAAVIHLLDALKEKNTKNGLDVVQLLIAQGTDIKFFLEKVLHVLHTLLLIKVGISKEKAAVDLDIEMIKGLVVILSKAHAEIKTAVLPQLPLELAIVEWGGEELKVKSEKLKVVEEQEKDPVIPASEPESRNITKKMPDQVRHDKETVIDKTFLHQVLDTIKAEHHMLAGVLRSCRMFETAEGITIEVPSPFHKERLADKKALEVLEKVCEDITGKQMKLSVVLKS